MHKKFFKRSVQINSIIAILAILCIGFTIAIVQRTVGHKEEAITTMIVLYFGSIILICLVGCFVAPDFKYWIMVEGDYIIFEKSETDHRTILRRHSVVRQTRKEIVLQDERGTIISLAYNGEVLEFLKQERIE